MSGLDASFSRRPSRVPTALPGRASTSSVHPPPLHYNCLLTVLHETMRSVPCLHQVSQHPAVPDVQSLLTKCSPSESTSTAFISGSWPQMYWKSLWAQETAAQSAYLLPGASSKGYIWGPAGVSPVLPLEHTGEGHGAGGRDLSVGSKTEQEQAGKGPPPQASVAFSAAATTSNRIP